MRNHAEMREMASEVLSSYEPRDTTETMLARDVIDLLDELEEPVPSVNVEDPQETDTMRQLLVMFAIIISAAPPVLLGKYVALLLGFMLWAVEAIAYITIYQRRHEAGGKWWTGVFIGLIALVYGPTLLAFDFLQATRFGKFMLRQDLRKEAA